MKTLADRAQAFLADPLRVGSAVPPEYRAQFAKVMRLASPGLTIMRPMLRAAKRFALSDSFVVEAVEAASVMMPKLLPRIDLANLPFRHVWIEWNNDVRVAAQTARGTSPPSLAPLQRHHGGALISRLADTRLADHPGYWEAVVFGDDTDDPTGPALCAAASQTINPASFPWSASREAVASQLGISEVALFQSGWGYAAKPGLGKEFEAAMAPLFERGQTVPSPWVRALVEAGRGDVGIDLFTRDAQEDRGDLRFLVTVLAMLNCTPVHYVHQPAPGRFTRRLHSMDYLDSHVVTLKPTRTKLVRLLERAAREHEAAHKRAHDVRGFWRVERSATWRPCAHEPMGVSDDGKHALCASCGKKLTFVDSHRRGDASLGFVTKTYEVTT